MKINDIINEAAVNVKSVGIPDALISAVFSEANLDSNVEPVAINSKKQMMDLLRDNVVFSVGNDGSAGAISMRDPSNWDRSAPGAILYIATPEGTVQQDYKTLSAAISGIPRGKYYTAALSHGGYYRRRANRHADRASDAIGRENSATVSYLNDTFGEKIKAESQEAITHIKNIYFDANPRWAGYLKEYVKQLQTFIDRGITRDVVEEWLRVNNKRDVGWGSIPNNVRNFYNLMKDEPNANAKFAKFMISWIRRIREQADQYASYD